MQIWTAVVGAVALFALIPEGESIICYQCKSWENPDCWDIKQNVTDHKYAKFCDDDAIPADAAPFCRTIRQKIQDGNGTERLWRKCGWEEQKTKDGMRHPRSCYVNNDAHHEETVCQCFFDLCNAATTRSASPLGLLAVTVAVLLPAVLRIAS